jgi:hypothetical protein
MFRPRPDDAVGDIVNDQTPGGSCVVTGCLTVLSMVVLFLSIIGTLTVASWVF